MELYIENNYYDDDANAYTIDVWQGEEEQGHVAAIVNATTGDVYYIDNTSLRWDDEVNEAVEEVRQRIKRIKAVKVGASVRWYDPAINDYPEDERLSAVTREFIVSQVDTEDENGITQPNSTIHASDGVTEVEAFAWEFTPLNFEVLVDGKLIGRAKNRKEVDAIINEDGDDKVYEIKAIEF